MSSQDNMNDQLRVAALGLASQLSDGSLKQHPMDEEAARIRLQMHISAGDITPEELGERTHLWT